MKCYSLLLGARHTASPGPCFSAADDRRIREITRRHFPGGFTILEASGGWFDPEAKDFVAEESRQILVCAPRRSLAAWCRELARALNQQELLVVELGAPHSFRAGALQRVKHTGAKRGA
jgi:hypothetical protein